MTRPRSMLTTLACLAGGAACAVCLGIGRALATPPALNLSLDSAGNYRTANSATFACRPAAPKNVILQKTKQVFKPVGFKKARKELQQQIQHLSKRIKRASGKKRKVLLSSRSKRKATVSFISLCAARRLAAIHVTYDHEGVAHATGATDANAFTSLGYAHASHRLLQMVLRRLQVQGRLAEFLGARFGTGENTFDALASDRKFRTLSYDRRAKVTLHTLNPADRRLLEAFALGVNQFILERAGRLPIAFDRLGISEVEPWRPEDSLAVYAVISSLFVGGGGESDNEIKFLADVAEVGADQAFDRWLEPVRDDAAAIVKAPGSQSAQFDPSTLSAHIPPNMKASHNWVVAGDRLTTNRPVMVGLPMLKVDLRVLYPARISSPNFNAYGVGFAGSPGFLLGFTDHTSWAVTALSADAADEVRLTPAGPDHYLLDGAPVPYEKRVETIYIKGADPVPLTVRTSRFGPVISDITPNQNGDVLALRTVLLYEPPDGRRDPVEGLFALMRARTVEQFRDAAWRILYPAVHMIFASDEGASGSIAYMPVIGMPIRNAPLQGLLPLDGSRSANDWEGLLSKERVPFLRDPVEGYIVTANDLATNDRSIYGYGGFGYSDRAWRLHRLIRAKLGSGQRIPADDISGLRFDCGHAVLDSFLALAEHMLATYPELLPNLPVIKTALSYLRNTPDLALTRPYGPLARNLVKLLGNRFRATPMETRYGPSTPGLIHLLRLFELDQTEIEGPFLTAIGSYISTVISEAWEQTTRAPNDPTTPGFGPDPAHWLDVVPRTFRFTWGRDLLLPNSIDPAFEKDSDPIVCEATSTIRSQSGNTYTQITVPGRPELAEATFYPGPSDDPESPAFLSTLQKWERGEVSPALTSTPRLASACAATGGCQTKKAVIATN